MTHYRSHGLFPAGAEDARIELYEQARKYRQPKRSRVWLVLAATVAAPPAVMLVMFAVWFIRYRGWM